jgi:hypothetical protein
VLINNYSQAKGCMMKMEARLEKTVSMNDSIGKIRTTWTEGFSDVSQLKKLRPCILKQSYATGVMK